MIDREIHQSSAQEPDPRDGLTAPGHMADSVCSAGRAARDRLAQSIETEAGNAGVDHESQPAQLPALATRGPGGVLYQAGIPRRVIVRSDDVSDRKRLKSPGSADGSLERLNAGECLYVFEESATGLLAGRLPDRDLALGWIAKNRTQPWNARTVIVDRHNSILSFFQPDTTGGWSALSSTTGQQEHSPGIPAGRVAEVYTAREITSALAALAELQGFSESGRLKPAAMQKLLSRLISELQFDFVDLRELAAVVDERNFETELAQAGKATIKREIDRLLELYGRAISDPDHGQLLILSDP